MVYHTMSVCVDCYFQVYFIVTDLVYCGRMAGVAISNHPMLIPP